MPLPPTDLRPGHLLTADEWNSLAQSVVSDGLGNSYDSLSDVPTGKVNKRPALRRPKMILLTSRVSANNVFPAYFGRQMTHVQPIQDMPSGDAPQFRETTTNDCVVLDTASGGSAEAMPLIGQKAWCFPLGTSSVPNNFPVYVSVFSRPATPLEVQGRSLSEGNGIYTAKIGRSNGGYLQFATFDGPTVTLENQFEINVLGSSIIPSGAKVWGWYTGGIVYATNYRAGVVKNRQNPTTGDLEYTTAFKADADYVDADWVPFAIATRCAGSSAAEFSSF